MPPQFCVTRAIMIQVGVSCTGNQHSIQTIVQVQLIVSSYNLLAMEETKMIQWKECCPKPLCDQESADTEELTRQVQEVIPLGPGEEVVQNQAQEAPVKAENHHMVVCQVHNLEIIFICERVECQGKRCLCVKCITDNLDHFTSHQPMRSADEVLRDLNLIRKPNDKDIKVEIQNQVKSLTLKFTQSILERVREIIDRQNQLICQANEMNREQYSCLTNEFLHAQEKELSDSFDDFLHGLKQAGREGSDDYIVSMTTTIIHQNKNNKLKESYFEKVRSNYLNPQFPTSEEIIEKLVSVTEKGIEDQKENSQIKKLLNDVPRCKVKVKSIEDFKKLTPDHIMFNTRLYIDLFKFSPLQMKECLTLIYFLPAPELVIRFRGKIDRISLLLNDKCKHLSLNFSECKCQLEGLIRLENSFEISNADRTLNLQSLSLDFSMNGLGDTHVSTLVKILEKVVDLFELNLNMRLNCLSLTGIISLSNCLRKFKNLCSLTLNFDGFGVLKNSMGTDALQHLCETISQLRQLRKLSLSLADADINSMGVYKLRDTLGNLKELKLLDLSIASNEVDGDALIALLKVFGWSYKLKVLKLNIDNIKLDEGTARLFVKTLETLSHLSEIIISARSSNTTFSSLNADFRVPDTPKRSKISKMMDQWKEEAISS